MKPDEIKKLIQEEIKKAISDMQFNIPLHAHTGIDSPKIDAQYLKITPNVGIPFRNGDYYYSIFNLDTDFVIEPSYSFYSNEVKSRLYFGKTPFRLFNLVEFQLSGKTVDDPTYNIYVSDSTDSSVAHLSLTPNLFNVQVLSGITGTYGRSLLSFNKQEWTSDSTSFHLKLPISGVPTAEKGGIYYNGTNFYACVDGVSWQLINLT